MQETITRELSVTGTQVNYYFVCRKKLWLFSRNISMEQSSDHVTLGKLLHETGYARKFKEIEIGSIKIDFLEKGCEIHEIKRSRKIEKAHEYQLLYYLYYLKKLGVEGKGVLNYPLLRKNVEVKLDGEKEAELKGVLEEIREIVASPRPPQVQKKGYCKKCSYYELCWC